MDMSSKFVADLLSSFLLPSYYIITSYHGFVKWAHGRPKWKGFKGSDISATMPMQMM